MEKLITSILALLIAGPAAAQCGESLIEILVFPEDPAVGETVTVTISGVLVTSCWSVADFECGVLANQEMGINVDLYDDANDEPIHACNHEVLPFERSCEYVFDAPGTYLVHLLERIEPYSTCREAELLFEVASGVPIEGESWSAVKAMYR